MEAMGLALSVTQTLFAALQCNQLKHILRHSGYGSELEQLEGTIKRINAVLKDAEGKDKLSNQDEDLIRKLKDAVYDADDLLDKFKTLAEQETLHLQVKKGSKPYRKVRDFFAHFSKKLRNAKRLTCEFRAVMERLERISSDANKYRIEVDNLPLRKRREEECSYVYEPNIIGREDDMKRVIDMLLDEGNDNNVRGDVHVPVVSIVGMGGMGKTTLAQLVFNDKIRIAKGFPLRLWACVADEGHDQFDVRGILVKILESATQRRDDGSSLELVSAELQKKLLGKKYLLILDDVWTEKRGQWMELEKFLKGGLRGSRILVTTRSEGTARVIGKEPVYWLGGLSDEKAWNLFKLVAFGQEMEETNPPELLRIGRDIVEKCSGVPLAVKVVGSLLYGQGNNKWVEFQKTGLAGLGKEEVIMWTLRFSFDNLESPLKSCFSYCALFPKDFVIEKHKLIYLWMAQGYLGSSDEYQSIIDKGEQYFSVLLRRCFFQDVKKIKDGEVTSCKIHDLMHDIAQGVAGDEVCVVNSGTKSLSKYVRHVYHFLGDSTEGYLGDSKIRTYIQYKNYRRGVVFCCSTLLSSLICLRTLDLSNLGIQHLPDTIGDLLHLRYLDLCGNTELKMLPKSITKMLNLQILRLKSCKVRALPEDFSKLIKLQVLHVPLYCMSQGLGQLTCLEQLNVFAVGEEAGKLEDLRALRELKGDLLILIARDYNYLEEAGTGRSYLNNNEGLTETTILFSTDDRGYQSNKEALLERLQPHTNLRFFELWGYGGVKIPKWAEEGNLASALPNLVELILYCCPGLQKFPGLGKLPCLKRLRLDGLKSIEYVECTNRISNRAASGMSSVQDPVLPLFFPSLERLQLRDLENLKGWWDGSVVEDDSCIEFTDMLPSFPRLSWLMIQSCPKLTLLPGCAAVEELTLTECNERLKVVIVGDGRNHSSSISASHPSSSACLQNSELKKKTGHPGLRIVRVDNANVACFKSQPSPQVFHYLTEMHIVRDHKIENLSEIEEVLRSCSSSLRNLEIHGCTKLKSIFGGGLEHLTSLESLYLSDLEELTFDEEEDEGGMSSPWQSFAHCLCKLVLRYLPKIEKLPAGMSHLTSLQSLKIDSCPLEDPPEWTRSRESLHFCFYK